MEFKEDFRRAEMKARTIIKEYDEKGDVAFTWGAYNLAKCFIKQLESIRSIKIHYV